MRMEYWGPEMKILVENDTDHNITAQINTVAINWSYGKRIVL